MRSTHLALITLALALPIAGAAQSPNAADTTQPAPKKSGGLFGKKGGLFGKAKALTQNKLVQTVAKTAACNMVPGGQYIAGALDKGSPAKSGKESVAGAAAGAALGAATAKANPCGGMGLMGNLGAGKLAPGIPGAGLPGMPTTGMPGMAITAEQMKQMTEQYKKMGMKPAQIQAMQQQMQAANAGAPGVGMSAEQLKQMQAQYQAMGLNPAQIQAMQQQMVTGAMPGSVEQPAAAAAAAPTQPVAAPTLTNEKGRLVLRQLPWTPGSEEIQSGAESALVLGLHNAAAEIIPTAKRYSVQVKVEDQGSKPRNQELAQKRAAVVVAVLVGEGVPQDRLTVVPGGSDKDPRVVLSETKGTK